MKELDTGSALNYGFNANMALASLEEEYGVSNYGKVKYSKDELYWIGHFYRYFCYTYGISSNRAYRIVKPKELRMLYQPYHTLDTSQAIERILAAKRIDLSVEGMNRRMLELYREGHGISTLYATIGDTQFEAIYDEIINTLKIPNEGFRGKTPKVNDVITLRNLSTNKEFTTKITKVDPTPKDDSSFCVGLRVVHYPSDAKKIFPNLF
ncbi:MAG: hypothetical protein ACI32C_03825 [Candidatus Enteromonas sp.]